MDLIRRESLHPGIGMIYDMISDINHTEMFKWEDWGVSYYQAGQANVQDISEIQTSATHGKLQEKLHSPGMRFLS